MSRLSKMVSPKSDRRMMGRGYLYAGALMTTLVLTVVAVGPIVAPYSPVQVVDLPLASPSPTAWLGTDLLGRDVLSRTLFGGLHILWMACLGTLIGVSSGLVLGIVAGYAAGAWDALIMRLLDILHSFPGIVLIMLVTSLVGSTPITISLLVALAWVPGSARVLRGATTEIRQKEFVMAASVNGMPVWKILAFEIFPNLTTPLLVEFSLRITWSIALVAALGFLGLGLQPPTADWGLMINENRTALVVQPWGLIAPAVLVALFTVGTNFIAEGVGRRLSGIEQNGREK